MLAPLAASAADRTRAAPQKQQWSHPGCWQNSSPATLGPCAIIVTRRLEQGKPFGSRDPLCANRPVCPAAPATASRMCPLAAAAERKLVGCQIHLIAAGFLRRA